MKTEVYGMYAPNYDITFVMEEKFTDDDEPVSLEVKGFYYGEPNEYCNKTFYGDLIAHFNDEHEGGMTVKKFLKRVADWFVFVFTGKGHVADEAVDNDIVDYSGQGRDKYGK